MAHNSRLIDPENRTIEIFRPGPLPESLPNPESVAGEGPVEGFILSLPPVRDRLKSPQLMIKANSQDVAALRRKNFVELCDPVRGLVEDIEFRRNLSTARPLDL